MKFGHVRRGTTDGYFNVVAKTGNVNDDAAGNRFYDSIGRFPEIDEDEEPLHLLVNDYQTFL